MRSLARQSRLLQSCARSLRLEHFSFSPPVHFLQLRIQILPYFVQCCVELNMSFIKHIVFISPHPGLKEKWSLKWFIFKGSLTNFTKWKNKLSDFFINYNSENALSCFYNLLFLINVFLTSWRVNRSLCYFRWFLCCCGLRCCWCCCSCGTDGCWGFGSCRRCRGFCCYCFCGRWCCRCGNSSIASVARLSAILFDVITRTAIVCPGRTVIAFVLAITLIKQNVCLIKLYLYKIHNA